MYEKEMKFILDYAKNKVEDIEILLSENDSFSIKINNQEINSFNKSRSKGLGVQVINKGKSGYSYTEKFDEETFKFIVDSAIKNSMIIENEDIKTIENHKTIQADLELYNDDLDKIEVDKKIEIAKLLEKLSLEEDERVVSVPYSGLSNGSSFVKIVNSKGLDKEEKGNYAVAYTGVLVSSGTDKRMGMDYCITRNFEDIDPAKLAKTAVKKAIDLLDGKEIESGNYPIVFNNDMMATMLSTFSSIFSAKTVQDGQSILKGKLETAIANEKVSIIDDGLLVGGMSSSLFDSEGYPNEKTVIIDKGILKSFLHNTETAAKDKVNSTGNGTRGYKSSLVVAPTNFYLEKGENSREDLFVDGKIIEIVSLQGMHSGANTISGDFSLSGEGYLWENGERQYSLKSFTVSGNIFELFNNIEKIGDDFKFNTSSFGASSTLIKSLSISS